MASDMPDRIAIDANGFGWRVWDDEDYWSMVPTNPDNSPIPQPVTWFVRWRTPMAESLRDAIAAALHRSQCERGDYGGCRGPADPEHQADAAEAEAAALGWFADWLRSDEARIEAEAASIGDLSDPLAALADALTKENPDG